VNYKNFNLRIGPKLNGGYPVVVDAEDMGQATGTFSPSPECLELAEQLKKIEGLDAASPAPMNLGLLLYSCLFEKNVGRKLYECQGAVTPDQRGLRIRLRLTPAEIAALPWEVLYDQEAKCFLATSDKNPLTRYIELSEPIRALTIEPPVKVLTLIPGGSGLDVETELRIIREALSNLEAVEMDVLKDRVTRTAISDALVQDQYHILHFIGHGTFENDDGYLLINSEDGGEDRISAATFADFFRNHPSLKLAVLNACQGAEVAATRELAGVAPQLVARGIPAVVAMQYPITDKAALVFAREFYLKLCSGWSRGQVEMAISHARNRIYMDVKEAVAFATPVLFMRSDTGIIFDLKDSPQQQPLLRRLSAPLGSAPAENREDLAKNVSRLKQVKLTHEKNIEVLHEIANEEADTARERTLEEIRNEHKAITAVDKRIVHWRRAFLASIVAMLLMFFVGYTGLFDVLHADDWLATRFIPYMDEFVAKKFSPSVRLILADEGVNGSLDVPDISWRRYHGSLIDKLSEAGAKVIVFDLELNRPNPASDKDFAAAIERAKSRGTRVILGKGLDELGNIKPDADLSSELANAAGDDWGNYEVGGSKHGGIVRIYQLGQLDRKSSPTNTSETAVLPSMGLQAVSAFLSNGPPVKAFFDEDRGQIQLRADGRLLKNIPVYENSYSDYDFPFSVADRADLKTITKSYVDVFNQQDKEYLKRQYQNTIVLIGFKTSEDLFNVFQAEKRYGAEIHANVISNLLVDSYVSLLSTPYELLISIVMVGAGVLVKARFSHVFATRIVIPFTDPKKTIEIPGLLIAADVAYLLIAFLLYKNQLIFILKTYHLVAPFVAYWLTGKLRKRTTLPAPKGLPA
jgi:CHASE2 domain-containing sensor protein